MKQPPVLAVAVLGAAGRMGRAVIEAAESAPRLRVSAAIERPGSPALGRPSGAEGIPVTEDLDAAEFEVAVDFTSPEATLQALKACLRRKKGLVIGTTGFTAEQRRRLQSAARSIPVCLAANFSVGVAVAARLAEQAAAALGEDYDVEIVELHHRHKADAPSGTALRLGEGVARVLRRDLRSVAVYGRHGRSGARDRAAIGFATVRGGDVVGDHTVMFLGDGERIEIAHKATSRANFARGALRAARWLRGRPPGLYGMEDVLGL